MALGSGRLVAKLLKSRLVPRSLHRAILRFAGYILELEGFCVTENRYSASYLNRYGFDIATFIDVGVFKGSPAFYELFRKRKLVLIDPLPGTLERTKPQLKGADVDFLPVAVGSSESVMSLAMDGPMSSLLRRVDREDTFKTVDVPVRLLDNIVTENNYAPPFGLKIDAEGFDLEVIRGASETLKRAEFVFTEAHFRRLFDGGCRFSELVAEMALNGFDVAEIIPFRWHNRGVDVLFVRSDGKHLNVDGIRTRQAGAN